MGYTILMQDEIEAMTIEELEAELATINAQRTQLKQEALAVHAVLDAKNVRASAARKLATLSDAEMAAAVQMINTQAVASNGAVGTAAI